MSDQNNLCPICKTKGVSSSNKHPHLDAFIYDCPRCGSFVLMRELVDDGIANYFKRDDKKRAVLSHYINKAQDGENEVQIYDDILQKIIDGHNLPSVTERAERLLILIGEKSQPSISCELDQRNALAFIGAGLNEEIFYYLGGLAHDELIENQSTMGMISVLLTFEGWQQYEELKRGVSIGHKAFMAMRFNDQMKSIVNNHFKPAVKETGFDLFVLDDNPKPGLIDDRLRTEIKSSRFLISDLTHGNNGAYWEAGYAEGLGKPVIFTCEKKTWENPKKKPHFDANHMLTIIWDSNDLEDAVENLKNTIRAEFPDAIQQAQPNPKN